MKMTITMIPPKSHNLYSIHDGHSTCASCCLSVSPLLEQNSHGQFADSSCARLHVVSWSSLLRRTNILVDTYNIKSYRGGSFCTAIYSRLAMFV